MELFAFSGFKKAYIFYLNILNGVNREFCRETKQHILSSLHLFGQLVCASGQNQRCYILVRNGHNKHNQYLERRRYASRRSCWTLEAREKRCQRMQVQHRPYSLKLIPLSSFVVVGLFRLLYCLHEVCDLECVCMRTPHHTQPGYSPPAGEKPFYTRT